MKYFITTYEDMILGGGETYFFRMSDWLKEREYQTFIFISKKSFIDETVMKEICKRNIIVVRYNNILKDKNVKKIFEKNKGEYLGIVYTKERYIRLRKLFEEYKVKYRLFFYIIALNRAVLKHDWFISRKIMQFICKPIVRSKAYVCCDRDTVDFCSRYLQLPECELLCSDVGVISKDLNIKQITGKCSTKFDILTVARFDFPQKGYILGLVRDFGKFSEICEYARLKIVGYGKCEPQILCEIEKLDLCVQNKIEIVGKVEYSELTEMYKNADLYIGMGTTLMEASSVGTLPVVASVFQYDNYSSGYFVDAKTMGFVTSGRYAKYIDVAKHKSYCFYELMIKTYKMSNEEYIEKRIENYEYYKNTYSMEIVMKNFIDENNGKPCCLNVLQKILFWYLDFIQDTKILVKYFIKNGKNILGKINE